MLTVTKVDSPDPVIRGGSLSCTIQVRNSGGPATGVTVTETYDSDVQFVSANPPPNIGNNQWNVGSLASGASWSVTVQVTISQAADHSLTNQVRVTCNEGVNAQATEVTAVYVPVVATYSPAQQACLEGVSQVLAGIDLAGVVDAGRIGDAFQSLVVNGLISDPATASSRPRAVIF